MQPDPRPVLFRAHEVQATLAGRMTQFRRVAKFQPLAGSGFNPAFSGLQAGFYCTGVPTSGWVLSSRGAGGCWNDRTDPLHCPYGQPGDRLGVRETWADISGAVGARALAYRAGCPGDELDIVVDGEVARIRIASWRPSIHMPRWASRLTLEVVGVRVQRLQEISEEDALAEGVSPFERHWWTGYDPRFDGYPSVCVSPGEPPPAWMENPKPRVERLSARERFASLWDSLNGKRASWASNPWVWAVTFKPVPAEVTRAA